ncbi:RFC checkpoint protein Rad17 [Dimargaris verticillata]|uniref:RFC checkpoint protein Rad17 n=1 Tax=Dimargaris verticillata TaxID=2761393 RepID=A0A9W8B4I9_9FUNG|nr:RFC checkpoint protein Rad17 [Dimargaris verticillata]
MPTHRKRKLSTGAEPHSTSPSVALSGKRTRTGIQRSPRRLSTTAPRPYGLRSSTPTAGPRPSPALPFSSDSSCDEYDGHSKQPRAPHLTNHVRPTRPACEAPIPSKQTEAAANTLHTTTPFDLGAMAIESDSSCDELDSVYPLHNRSSSVHGAQPLPQPRAKINTRTHSTSSVPSATRSSRPLSSLSSRQWRFGPSKGTDPTADQPSASQGSTASESRTLSQLSASLSQQSAATYASEPSPTTSGAPCEPPVPAPHALWVDKYAPTTVGELAVHKRKVQDVQNWLEQASAEAHAGPTSANAWSHRILVLTGPPGVGKTATLRVLAATLGLGIMEWTNPIHIDTGSPLEPGEYVSLARQLERFVQHADRFSALKLSAESNERTAIALDSELDVPVHPANQVILIEDMPNLSVPSMRTAFDNCLRRYVQPRRPCCYPLVLIISDSYSRFNLLDDSLGSNVYSSMQRDQLSGYRQVLPRDILSSPYVTRLAFNPIAPTLLTKALKRVLALEWQGAGHKVRSVAQISGDLSVLVTNSQGDIRNALNTLQLSAPTRPGIAKSGPRHSRHRNSSPVLVSFREGRDSSLDLFHAVGKVLYNKRNPTSSPMQAEGILAELPVDYDMFTLFLHQNYLSFTSDIDDIVDASQHFSDADYLTGLGGWSHHTLSHQYGALLAVRGLAESIPSAHRQAPRSFHQMAKPQLWQAMRARRDMRDLSLAIYYDALPTTPTAGSPLALALAPQSALVQVFPFWQTILRQQALTTAQGPIQAKLYRLCADLNRLCLFSHATVQRNRCLDGQDWGEVESDELGPSTPNAMPPPSTVDAIPAASDAAYVEIPEDPIVDSD